MAPVDVVPIRSQRQSDATCSPGDLVWIPLDKVKEPGAYVCRGSRDLIRVPASGASSGSTELTEKHDADPIYVTRISTDPFVGISCARMAAANLDIEINF